MTNCLLALETSSRCVSAAVWCAENLVFEESFTAGRRETGPLASLMQRAWQAAGAPSALVVGTGPGSYNGLRAGIALGQGLALGQGIPCGGWSSLLAYPPAPRLLAGDARSGQVFLAMVQDHRFLHSPRLVLAEELENELRKFAGSEAAIRTWVGEDPPSARWQGEYPSAKELGLAAQQDLNDDNFVWPEPVPLYLKPPHITQPAKS